MSVNRQIMRDISGFLNCLLNKHEGKHVLPPYADHLREYETPACSRVSWMRDFLMRFHNISALSNFMWSYAKQWQDIEINVTGRPFDFAIKNGLQYGDSSWRVV